MAKRSRNAGSKQAILVQPCTRTQKNDTQANLLRRALGGQTVQNCARLHANFELDQSERKSSQAIAMESQVIASFQFAITCDSVWPGLYMD